MTVLLAVLAVGAGSVAFRLLPLLGAHLIPPTATRLAGRAGLSVLAAMTLRAVLLHHDPSAPGAPVLAALSLGAGLFLAYRGRSVLLSVAVGVTSYLLLSAATAALS